MVITSEAQLHAEVRARVGSVLGRKYRLERVLGVGGMGAVYEAVHRNGSRVAVKILHRAFATSEDVLRRFVREGLLANRIAHPGVVRIVDDDRAEDGSVFLVMELLEGATCRELADRQGGRLASRDMLVVTHAVLHVLEAAHREGVIHRDIKPNNVFVTRNGTVKLLDFGIARLNERGGAIDAMTHTGVSLGTPGFMCPEQVLGRTADVDARSDIWAVGAMMFNLLSGEHVHVGTTAQEMAIFTATRAARGLREVIDAPPTVSALVDRALALAPEHRWQSAREMLDELERAYADLHGGPIAEAHVVVPPASARSSLAFAPTARREAERSESGATLDPIPATDPRADTSDMSAAADWAPRAAVTPDRRDRASQTASPGRARRLGLVAVALVGVVSLAARAGVRSGASSPPTSESAAPAVVAGAADLPAAETALARPTPSASASATLVADVSPPAVAVRGSVPRPPAPRRAHDAPAPSPKPRAIDAGASVTPPREGAAARDPLLELEFR